MGSSDELMLKIYILLPVHNRRKLTEAFLKCLSLQRFTDYHLVVIDDGSTDRTADMVRQLMPNATILAGNGHLWWAGSLQVGFEWLCKSGAPDHSIVLIINDDVTFEPDFLADAVSELANNPRVLLLAKVFEDERGHIAETGIVADLKQLSFRAAAPGEEINCLTTRGLFLRLKDMKMIGGFHPKILPHYFSDYEYTIRAKRRGLNLITEDSVVLYQNPSTTGYHTFEGLNLPVFLTRYFSRKSLLNPIYRSVFVIFAVPKKWMLGALARVWYWSARDVYQQIRTSALDAMRRLS
jgi:GT2 family glycosyltransferase